MGLRNAPRTIIRFVAAVTGLYFVIALALLVLAGRAFVGLYPIPSRSLDPVFEFALLVSVLLGAWFVTEEYSVKRLFAYTVSIWVLYYGLVFVLETVHALEFLLSVSSLGVGVPFLLHGMFAYLWSYRLVCPDAFAERRQNLDFDA
jgi:hypothetical protein